MLNTKIKRFSIVTVILFVAVIISGAVFQKTYAQSGYKYDCTKEYQTTQLTCLDRMKTCTAQCDNAYPYDPEGAAARCKSICDVDRNSCDARAVDWYRECLGLETPDQDLPAVDRDAQPTLPIAPAPTPTVSPPQTTIPPPTVTPKPMEQPPTQTMPPSKSGVDAGDDSGNLALPPTSNLPEEIIVDGTFYTVALVDASTKKDFEKMVSVVTKPGPEVSITLKSEPPTAFTAGRDAGIDSNALVPNPTYNFMLNTSNLAMVQPTIIFNDGTEDKFSLNVGELTRSLGTSDTDVLGADVDSSLQEKILEIMKKNPPVKTATFSISEISTKPLMILSTAEALTSLPSPPISSLSDTISAGIYFVAYPGSLVVLDADVNMNSSVMVGGPAVTSQTQDFDDKAMSRADAVFEIKNGKTIVVAGWSAEDTLSSASDFIFALDNVEVRHRKTTYGMAIDQDSGKKIIEIYDGEIDVSDRKTGAVLATLATEFGKGIKRVEIDKDGIVKRQIAIPQSEWPAFVARQQNDRSNSNAWGWILVIVVIVGIGYFAYHKKDTLLKILKKEPKQTL